MQRAWLRHLLQVVPQADSDEPSVENGSPENPEQPLLRGNGEDLVDLPHESAVHGGHDEHEPQHVGDECSHKAETKIFHFDPPSFFEGT